MDNLSKLGGEIEQFDVPSRPQNRSAAPRRSEVALHVVNPARCDAGMYVCMASAVFATADSAPARSLRSATEIWPDTSMWGLLIEWKSGFLDGFCIGAPEERLKTFAIGACSTGRGERNPATFA